MVFQLRDYQEEDIKKLRASLQSNGSVIYNLPTGGGKTASTSYMLQSLAKQGKIGWFICHRKELLEQASSAFTKQGIQHGLIGGKNKFNPDEKIQVCSVLSLLNKIDKLPYPDFVIWDECHHIAASTWQKIHDKIKDAKHLGLSATPIRLDGKGLDIYFKEIIRGISMKELIQRGYLSSYKIYAPSIPDLKKVGKIKGDFTEKQLDTIVNTSFIFGDILKHWNIYAKNKRTLIFCSTISHSKKVANDFRDSGINAVHLDSNCADDKRTKIIQDFESGKIQVLTNVDLISEGFDLPAIECVVLLRPTMSLGLYLQQVGRALRIMDGKKEAIILDHSGNSLKHGLPDVERYWNLEGKIILQNKSGARGRICDSCKGVISYLRRICDCGHEQAINTKEITYLDGELKEAWKPQWIEKLSMFTEEQAKEIINLYYDGWGEREIIKKVIAHLPNSERSKECSVNKLTQGKIFTHLNRPNISREELENKRSKRRFDKSYTIDIHTGCWNWKTVKSSGGITFRHQLKTVSVIKYAYEYYHGTVEPGTKTIQICNNKRCVNPEHLKNITQSEHIKILLTRYPDMYKGNGKRLLELMATQQGRKKYLDARKKLDTTKKLWVWKEDEEKRLFNSYKEAAQYIGTIGSTISFNLKKGRKTLKGFNIQKVEIF